MKLNYYLFLRAKALQTQLWLEFVNTCYDHEDLS